MITSSATVGPRGRLVIPAEVRRDAGIEEGQVVVLMPEGHGRVTVTTREAIEQEVWAAASQESRHADAALDVRAFRDADNQQWAQRHATAESGDGLSVRGDLLREFGLAED
jgi:AbrB family looped-hinge helix DNA binding protein